jgi:hypothetical protein
VQTIALGLVGWMFLNHVGGIPLLIAIVAFTGAFAMALGPIGWLFCAEIFPNKVRGRAMSVASFTVWVSCYIVAQTFPMLNDSPHVGPAITARVPHGSGPGSRDEGAVVGGDRRVLEAASARAGAADGAVSRCFHWPLVVSDSGRLAHSP